MRREEKLVAKSLDRVAERHGLEVVLLPIGHYHGDLEALRSVREASANRFTLVEDVTNPLEIGALIGACDYFVGSRLQRNLTALPYGIPHIVVKNALRAAELEGYVQLADLEDFRITGWDALVGAFDRLAAAPREGWTSRRDRLQAPAREYFDRIAELIEQSAAQRQNLDAGGRTPASRRAATQTDGEVSLGVYETIAALHERLDDERAARRRTVEDLRAAREELRQRQSALRVQLERARARSEHLEREPRGTHPGDGELDDLAPLRPLPAVALGSGRCPEQARGRGPARRGNPSEAVEVIISVSDVELAQVRLGEA